VTHRACWTHLTRRVPAALLATALVAAGCSDNTATPPPPAANVTPVDRATAGTIDVIVSYTGPVPAPKPINMAGTPACAALHPQPVDDQSLVVDDGHLVNAVVYIQSGFNGRPFAPPSEPVEINQQGCLYHPHVAAVMVGQALRFKNSDREAHNVHGRPKVAEAWNFLMSRPDSTRDVYLRKPEIGIPVGCDVHPWMRAYVSVFDNPYFAVTPASGRVSLAPVPPGTYVVGVWHETLGTLVKPVTLAASGTAQVTFDYHAPDTGG
jgi:plastocyanin